MTTESEVPPAPGFVLQPAPKGPDTNRPRNRNRLSLVAGGTLAALILTLGAVGYFAEKNDPFVPEVGACYSVDSFEAAVECPGSEVSLGEGFLLRIVAVYPTSSPSDVAAAKSNCGGESYMAGPADAPVPIYVACFQTRALPPFSQDADGDGWAD